MTPGPSFGAPMNPKLGAGNGPSPSSQAGPPGAPGAGAPGDSDNDSDTAQDPTGSSVAAVMGQIRDLGTTAAAIASSTPALQPEVQQITAIIKRMIVKAGQSAPTQTDSASALPM
jgi:hypothetical protein